MTVFDYTIHALDDCLGQVEVDPYLLVINQGSTNETRAALEQYAEQHAPRVRVVTHDPPLPSLGATWNRGLRAIWAMGGRVALVVNNDVRLHTRTYTLLRGALNVSGNLFVSGIGVTPEEFRPDADHPLYLYDDVKRDVIEHGGPDFSCYVISRIGHEAYPFDERFEPAYCEDVDMHRRMMLDGNGHLIFGVNLPFLHYGSRTINRSPETARAFAPKYEQSVAYYTRKWGGRPNAETFLTPFGADEPVGGARHTTTPDLHAHGCTGCRLDGDIQSGHDAGGAEHTVAPGVLEGGPGETAPESGQAHYTQGLGNERT